MQEQVTQQQLQLLAQKALVMEQLKNIDTQLGQLAAVQQVLKAQAEAAAPAPTPEPAAPTE
jgi:hypothetical protein